MSKRCAFFITLCTFIFAQNTAAQSETFPGAVERLMAPSGEKPDEFTAQPHLSYDGRHLLFSSKARNLLPGMPANVPSSDLYRQWYLLDRRVNRLERISVNNQGQPQNGALDLLGFETQSAAMSDDLRFIVFDSSANNLGAAGGPINIFVRDRSTQTTWSLPPQPGEHQFSRLTIVQNSHELLYACTSTEVCRVNLVSRQVRRIALPSLYRAAGAFSIDGRFVLCKAPGIALGLSNHDYFGRCDLSQRTVRSIGWTGALGGSKFSADGNKLVFSALGPINPSHPVLIPDVYNGYVWDASGDLRLLTVGPAGDPSNDLYDPLVDISDDGRRVAFMSFNPNLGSRRYQTFQARNVIYVRDLDSTTNRYVALTYFDDRNNPLGPGIASCEISFFSIPATPSTFTGNSNCPELSGDGNTLAFSAHEWRFVSDDDKPEALCARPFSYCSRLLDVFVRPLNAAEVTIPTLQPRVQLFVAAAFLLIGMIMVRRRLAPQAR